MRAGLASDGSEVTRLTNAEGYDGGAGSAPLCVAGEEVYAGRSLNGPSRTWDSRSCFDLTQFAGQTKERLGSRQTAGFVSGVIKDAFSLWL